MKLTEKQYLVIILVMAVLLMMSVLQNYFYIKQSYKSCRNFNFMAYLNTEMIRHYQNASFELTALPDCEFYKFNFQSKGKLTYDQFLTQNNLTHINWSDNNETQT